MNRIYKKTGVLACLFIILSLSLLAPYNTMAGNDINITVTTILASEKGNSVDPKLKGLVKDLPFKYSSYDFLGEKRLRISLNKKVVVSLPGQRVMNIVARGIEGSRVVLDIEILKNNSQIAQASIKLRNHDSTFIGGQEYKGGYLFFNIFASF